MSLSASEFHEAGMNLPPSVRKDVALRLLESLGVADDDGVEEAWTAEIGSRADDILSGKVRTVPLVRSKGVRPLTSDLRDLEDLEGRW